MGQLVRRKLDNFYNGVSRQPPSLRLPNQIEQADNLIFSVVSGGFSKRPGAEHVAALNTDALLVHPSFHSYKRDDNEAYFVAVEAGQIYVWDQNGQRQDVTVEPSADQYLDSIQGSADATLATLLDATFVVNKNIPTAIDPASTATAPLSSYASVQVIQFAIQRDYSLTVDFRTEGDPSRSGTILVSAKPLDQDLTYDAGDGAEMLRGALNALLQGTALPRETYGSLNVGANVDFTNWAVASEGSFIFIRAADELSNPYDSFIVSTTDSVGGGSFKHTSDYARDASDLPAKSWGGHIARIGGADENDGNQYFRFTLLPDDGSFVPPQSVSYGGDGTTTRYEVPFEFGRRSDVSVALGGVPTNSYVWDTDDAIIFDTAPADGVGIEIFTEASSDSGYGQGFWKEVSKPGNRWQFDASTLPHVLVRQADATFHFGPANGTVTGADGKPLTWARRLTGDENSAPEPDFVGRRINGIGFHRSRLYLLADEFVCFSQVDDFFNFWPDSVAQVIDSDPFSRAAGTRQVQVLRQAYPFRRSLVVSSEQSQFEVSSPNTLTPNTAAIDEATAYTIETICQPVALGSEVYFATRNGASADVLEYYYDESSLSNDADRIARHVADYIPAPIVELAGDATTGYLFARSASDDHAVYVYRLYWQGREKKQSAWCRWTFANEIVSIQVFGGYSWLITRGANGGLELVRIPLNENAAVAGLPYPCRMDYWDSHRGSYDSTSRTTQWLIDTNLITRPRVLLGDGFGPSMAGREISVEVSGSVITADGDLSAHDVFIGSEFTALAELSKVYLREEGGRTTTAGRLQLRNISFEFTESGSFDVNVTPFRRATRTYRRSPLSNGRPGFVLDETPPLDEGAFKAPVRSRAESTRITVTSDNPSPFTITSADWLGFYHDHSQ